MYYDLRDPIRSNIIALLSEAPIRGSDSDKIVAIGKALDNTKHDPYYEIDENLAKFAASVMQEVTIKGKFAAPLLEAVIRLNKPMKEIPAGQPKPTPQPSPGAPSQKASPVPPKLPGPLQPVTQNDTKTKPDQKKKPPK
jgi:hypothetical protein